MVSSRSKAATLRGRDGAGGVADVAFGEMYFPTIKLLATILHRSVSGSFCDVGLKKLATALSVFDQLVGNLERKRSLVVMESSLRLTAGGDRGRLEGERGRLPPEGVDMTATRWCEFRPGNAVHGEDALKKGLVRKSSSFNSQTAPHTLVISMHQRWPWCLQLRGGRLESRHNFSRSALNTKSRVDTTTAPFKISQNHAKMSTKLL